MVLLGKNHWGSLLISLPEALQIQPQSGQNSRGLRILAQSLLWALQNMYSKVNVPPFLVPRWSSSLPSSEIPTDGNWSQEIVFLLLAEAAVPHYYKSNHVPPCAPPVHVILIATQPNANTSRQKPLGFCPVCGAESIWERH